MSPNPRPFNIMTKPIGPRCNIDCEYCYYLEKEKKFRMSDEVLETYDAVILKHPSK